MDNEYHNWYTMEDSLLVKLYTVHGLDLDELSKIHKRTPETLRKRLIKLKVIEDNSNFILKELESLIVQDRSINKITLLCQLLSDRFKKYYRKMESLEKELSDLKEFLKLKEID